MMLEECRNVRYLFDRLSFLGLTFSNHKAAFFLRLGGWIERQEKGPISVTRVYFEKHRPDGCGATIHKVARLVRA